MAMNPVQLTVVRRPTGKAAVKQLRRQGLVPGIFYGPGVDPIPIAARPAALRPLVHTRETHLVQLHIEGMEQTYECVLKDFALDPLTDALMHFDLQAVVADQPVEVEVPVKLVGTPVGVTRGGILEHALHTVRVSCLPRDLPEYIELDISGLDVGHAIHVRDVQLPGIRILEHGETVIATVIAPRETAEAEGTSGAVHSQ
jgi:large subunit ribosomal protein L25